MQVARRRRRGRTAWLYVLYVVREFRWTLFGLALALAAGSLLFCVTPHSVLGGRCPSPGTALFAAYMALLGEQPLGAPETWYLGVLDAIYPLVGFGVIGEGIVRFALLMVSRRHREKEWMKVMASTYRDHVILCGLGHLGYRVLEQLVRARVPVVAMEKDAKGRFLAQAMATGVPILIRDMKDDTALVEAGIEHARAIIIATNDDLANLEVLLDARRLNPRIRVVLRLFDQQIAGKIADAFAVDAAFSSSALAAPIVAAMSLEGSVLATYPVAGVPHMAAEVRVDKGSQLIGRTVRDLEDSLGARVVARVPAGGAAESPPPVEALVREGDLLVVHAAAAQLASLAAAAQKS